LLVHIKTLVLHLPEKRIAADSRPYWGGRGVVWRVARWYFAAQGCLFGPTFLHRLHGSYQDLHYVEGYFDTPISKVLASSSSAGESILPIDETDSTEGDDDVLKAGRKGW
jgi:hypothetical protein